MIRYALKCTNDHGFESWFASASAFDKLAAASLIACPVCGSDTVEKSLMAPSVQAGRAERAPDAPAGQAPDRPLARAASPIESMLADLRRKIEESAEYVGGNFVREARAIHEGEAPERAIYGEARPDEARALIEDGVQVAPLPFTPVRKTN